jgi:hypothetical protein
MKTSPLLLLLLLVALSAFGQNQEIQRELMLRQQQSDAFALQLRQSQELLKVPPAQRLAAESRQLSERHRLENLSAQQLREVRPDADDGLRSYERSKAQEERRSLLSPIVESPVKRDATPRPLIPAPKSNANLIEAPGP